MHADCDITRVIVNATWCDAMYGNTSIMIQLSDYVKFGKQKLHNICSLSCQHFLHCSSVPATIRYIVGAGGPFVQWWNLRRRSQKTNRLASPLVRAPTLFLHKRTWIQIPQSSVVWWPHRKPLSLTTSIYYKIKSSEQPYFIIFLPLWPFYLTRRHTWIFFRFYSCWSL
jgi:hypothetical protein